MPKKERSSFLDVTWALATVARTNRQMIENFIFCGCCWMFQMKYIATTTDDEIMFEKNELSQLFILKFICALKYISQF